MYTIALPDAQPKAYQQLRAATEFADAKSVELGVELEVVHAETGAVAFVASPVRGRLFHPWERVETPKHVAPHFEGWRPAYTRKRIEATVYRSYDEENELPWRVYDGRTKNFRDVATTKAACELTKAMRHGLLL